MLNEKVMLTEEGRKLASEFGMEFWETFANNDFNVKQSFQSIAKSVKDRLIADEGAGPGGVGGHGNKKWKLNSWHGGGSNRRNNYEIIVTYY